MAFCSLSFGLFTFLTNIPLKWNFFFLSANDRNRTRVNTFNEDPDLREQSFPAAFSLSLVFKIELNTKLVQSWQTEINE